MRNVIFLLCYIALAILVLLLFLKKSGRKRMIVKVIASIFISYAVILLVSFFPIENLFLEFDSVQDAFHYAKIGNMVDSVEGERSCLVIYQRQKDWDYCILPYEGKKYKVPGSLFENKLDNIVTQNGYFELLKAKGTNDYYIFGCSVLPSDEDCTINDSADSDFTTSVTSYDDTGYHSVFYWARVALKGDTYTISINGKKTKIPIEQYLRS